MTETCPHCGALIIDITICTMPPVASKKCVGCGKSWVLAKNFRETVVFNPEGWEEV